MCLFEEKRSEKSCSNAVNNAPSHLGSFILFAAVNGCSQVEVKSSPLDVSHSE